MLHAEQAASPVAIVVRWPQSAAPEVAQHLNQCLIDGGLAATWAMEHPAQLREVTWPRLRTASTEAALLVAGALRGGSLLDAVAAGAQEFQAAGKPVSTVQIAGVLPRDNSGRRVAQVGIRAVVGAVAPGRISVVSGLPLGVWQFSPHVAAPMRRRWYQWFTRRRPELIEGPQTHVAMAALDLGAVPAASGRAWRDVEQVLEEICDAQDRGAARVITVAQLAAELTAAAAPRPQRSILRAA